MPNGAKNWCFTLYVPEDILGYDVQVRTLIRDANPTFAIVGKEVCPTTGRPHYQGFIQFEGRKTLQQVSAFFVNLHPHLEVARGTAAANITYCTKETEFLRHGEPRGGQGRRTDIEGVLRAAENDEPQALYDVWQSHPAEMLRHHRAVETYHSLYRKRKAQEAGFNEKRVVVLWGATGAGKTRYATTHSDPLDTFILTETTTGWWWCGYDGESTVVVDEFTGNMPLSMLLRILDGHPCSVAYKGGTHLLRASTIYLTSNLPPESWYPNCTDAHKAALFRRINYIYRFYGTPRNGLIVQEKPAEGAGDKLIPEAQFLVQNVIANINN